MKKALKKISFFAFLFVLCLFVAQPTFSAGKADKPEKSERPAKEAKAEKPEKAKKEKPAKEAKADKTEKAKKEKPTKAEKPAKDAKKGDFDIAAGNLKAALHRETGTFTLYKLRDTGKNRYDPILDTRNYGAGTCFSVSVNDRTYTLEKRAFKEFRFEASSDGKEAAFIYTNPDDFEVRQRFYIEENSSFGQNGAALAIEITVENTKPPELAVEWRAVLDTVLGETRSSKVKGHFVTDSGRTINAETLVQPLESAPRYLFSSNGERTCAISLNGVESAYIANWNRCDGYLRGSFSRSIDCVEGRSLSSAYATDDSAVLLCWPKSTLKKGEAASVTLLLSAIDAQNVATANAVAATAALRAATAANSDAKTDADAETTELSEKQALYLMISGRLRQIISGEATATMSEIDDLQRVLDYLLEDD